MKYYVFLIFFTVLIQTQRVAATTYLKFWVNEDTSHTLTQGDFFAWEFDVANPGNTADVELWLDIDKSRNISEGDILLELFTQTDGETSGDRRRRRRQPDKETSCTKTSCSRWT